MLEDIRVRMLLDKELWTDLNNEARRRAGFGADVTQTAIFAPDILSSPWCVGPPPVWMLAPASGSHNFCLSLTDHSTWNMVNRAQMIRILISGDIIELSLHVLFYMYWFIYSWQAVQCSTWKKKCPHGTSLVVLWLRICLVMQGKWVQSLVGELRSHIPACHSERSCMMQLRPNTAR